MGRAPRAPVGNMVYHVLNRANGRMRIFRKPEDYMAFESILEEARKKQPMRVLAYCLMPNHWHMVLYTYQDGDLANFMRWLTLTHTQRWHAHYIGEIREGMKGMKVGMKVSGTLMSSLYLYFCFLYF